jgi:predicted DNA-binding protein (UPF0251 family)
MKLEDMSRPKRCRRVGIHPNVTFFKPAGIRMIELEEDTITLDEFEAIRLKDLLSFEQEECAKHMNISQPTFHRLIVNARKKIADALVNGKALRINGGNIEYETSPSISRNGKYQRCRGDEE